MKFQDDFANYEANDPWVQNVIVHIDTMLNNFKVSIQNVNVHMDTMLNNFKVSILVVFI